MRKLLIGIAAAAAVAAAAPAPAAAQTCVIKPTTCEPPVSADPLVDIVIHFLWPTLSRLDDWTGPIWP